MSECKFCGVEVTDETLKHVYYDEEHPDIDIGPYCISCLPKVRVCSGCHYPFEEGVDIKYFGDCLHYCDTCAEDIEACDHCGNIRDIYKTIDSDKYCKECFDSNYAECDCCGKLKRKHIFVSEAYEIACRPTLFTRFPQLCLGCWNKEKDNYEKLDVHRCDHCRGMFTDTTEGTQYCPGCISRFSKCDECGTRDPYVDYWTALDENGRRIEVSLCRSCLRNKYHTCSICKCRSKTVKIMKGKVMTKVVCARCASGSEYQECPKCFGFHREFINGECTKCHATYTNNQCSNCGMIRDDDGNCRACGHSKRNIYNYTLKPHCQFHSTPKDEKKGENLFLGIENEVTFESESSMYYALQKVYDNLGPEYVICKSDSSIEGHGFEIVTQPMTLDFLNNQMELQHLFTRSMLDDESCGCHIHVSRSAINGDGHIYKITNFVHSNYDFINRIAERDYNEYNEELYTKPSKVVLDHKKYKESERHIRVNLNNKHTIEFRMFAACLDATKIRVNAEFCHALVTWTDTVGITETSEKKFKEYIKRNVKTYSRLNRFLNLGGTR